MLPRMMLVFGAGYAWLVVSGIARRTNALEKIAAACGLGVAFAIFLGMLSLVTSVRIGLISDGAFICLIASGIGAWWVRKPLSSRFGLRISFSRKYLLLAALLTFHGLLWVFYLLNYPYFPGNDTMDVVWHSMATKTLVHLALTGGSTQVAFPTSSFGSRVLFTFVSIYFGVDVLPSLRITSAIIDVLSVLVGYCLFKRLFSFGRDSEYATVAFALLISAGMVYYVRLGAFPNMVGDFLVLTSLLIAVIVSERLTMISFLTAFFIEGIALFSHISVLIVSLLVIGFSAVVLVKSRAKLHAYLISNMGFFVLPVIVFVLIRSLSALEIQYIISYYLDLSNNLTLVLGMWLHNYILFAGPLNFVLLIVAVVWALITSHKEIQRIWSAFFVVWFGLLFLLVLIGTNDWRMVLLSFVPGAGLLGQFLSKLHDALESGLRTLPTRIRRVVPYLVMVSLIAAMVVSGPATYTINAGLTGGQATRQSEIYQSMIWLETNSPAGATVISVGLQKEYRYLPVIGNRSYVGDYAVNSSDILQLRSNLGFDYVVVSTDFSLLQSYYHVNSFRTVFDNHEVVIFKIATD